MSLNTFDRTLVVGRAGRDAESRFTPQGVQMTSFSLAVDRSYKDKSGEWIKRTVWYRVIVWGNFAATCANIKKGEIILAEGNLEADWETGGPKIYNKQDGSSGASFELKAATVRFLTHADNGMTEAAQDLGGIVPEDDVPF